MTTTANTPTGTGTEELALFDVVRVPTPPPPARPRPARPRTPSTPPPPIDEAVRTVLAALAGDPEGEEDRAAVVRAVLLDAREHRDVVDPNRVRTRLAGPDGRPALRRPQAVGAVYAALAARGVLEFLDWTPSTDRASGNAGRPTRLYRLTRMP